MAERERLIKELVELIEDNAVAWRKAAFYSDPNVEPIYDRLIRVWMENGERDTPISYATDEELRVLVSIAKKYAFMSEDKARAIAMSRMGGSEDMGGFGKALKRILGR
ncbi:MAG: hypothetical protein GSR73_03935 [Desulfurococcales archaeon]|nr:hypothetical protein [Desulfurococcales archaeon]